MARIGGILVVIYFVVGFFALWLTEDTTYNLLHPGINRSVFIWPLVLYWEHEDKATRAEK